MFRLVSGLWGTLKKMSGGSKDCGDDAEWGTRTWQFPDSIADTVPNANYHSGVVYHKQLCVKP